jgi:hypothetical protein
VRGLLRTSAVLVAAAALALPAVAAASVRIGVNTSDATIVADNKGRALVIFRSGGQLHRVLAWGAINARAPSSAIPQVTFKLDNRGGNLKNTCARVRLNLPWLEFACRAGDGSYWALQSWQRLLPNNGARPSPAQAAWELRLSHWTGPIASLDVHFGWSFGRFHQIFGRYTYAGKGVYGFRVRNGVPLDGYGRNIYVDALDSDVGKGWKRVNSFLAHGPIGAFCYGFFPHGGHLGVGRTMRATAIGPGVAPDVMWEGSVAGAYSKAADQAADATERKLLAGDKLCRPN